MRYRRANLTGGTYFFTLVTERRRPLFHEQEAVTQLLQAVETVQPALQDFYNSLGDDQRARFNTMGRQLSAVEQ